MIKPDCSSLMTVRGPLGRCEYWGQPFWACYVSLFAIMGLLPKNNGMYYEINGQLSEQESLLSVFDGNSVALIAVTSSMDLWVSKSDSLSDKPINLGDDVGFTVLERSFVDADIAKPEVEKYLKDRTMTEGFWEELKIDEWFLRWEEENS